MTRGYDIQRLETAQQARLERMVERVPRTSPYAGRLSPTESLRQAEIAHTNLSVGLFDGSELVGYVLAFVSPTPSPLWGEGWGEGRERMPSAAVVIADWAVAPRDRRAAAKLALRFGQMLREREDLRSLPLCFACANELGVRLAERQKFFCRLGYRLARRLTLQVPDTGQTLHALVFERRSAPDRGRPRTLRDALRSIRTYTTADDTLEVGVIQTVADWTLLEPHWNRLLAATRGATVHQTYEYLRAWWSHLGVACDLWIVVVLKHNAPVAIAPLHISLLRWLGDDLRCLSFIGSAPESDRPRVLAADSAGEHVLPLAQYIVAEAAPWDHLLFEEQHADDAFLAVLTRELRAAGHLVRQGAGPACPIVSLNTTWPEYLSRKTRAFRKSIKRKIAKLAEAGTARFENVEPRDSPQQPLDRYLAVERSSWKVGTIAGFARSSALVAFYRSLLARFAPSAAVQFHFLTLDDRTIAATFGLVWNRCFYSLHVAHDEAFADYSPGVVLTAMELEDAFERQSFDTFDFLSGTLANKAGWATEQLPSVDLLCTRSAIRGRLFHLIYFRMKPRVKKILARWRLLEWSKRLKVFAGRRADPADDAD